jgi:hypothetical protein
LDPVTEVQIEEDDEVITQKLNYNSNFTARSVVITSPAHKDLQNLEIVMHAHRSGYWHSGLKVNQFFTANMINADLFRIIL